MKGMSLQEMKIEAEQPEPVDDDEIVSGLLLTRKKKTTKVDFKEEGEAQDNDEGRDGRMSCTLVLHNQLDDEILPVKYYFYSWVICYGRSNILHVPPSGT